MQDGLLEVKLAGGKWGTVCAYNPPFDAKRNVSAGADNARAVARAVCRSLGYQGGTPQVGPCMLACLLVWAYSLVSARTSLQHRLCCSSKEG